MAQYCQGLFYGIMSISHFLNQLKADTLSLFSVVIGCVSGFPINAPRFCTMSYSAVVLMLLPGTLLRPRRAQHETIQLHQIPLRFVEVELEDSLEIVDKSGI